MRRFVIVVAALLSACGSSEKSATIDGTTYTSDDSKGTASITTDKGTVRTADGAAAQNVAMPAYAPRYPGATISGVIETETDGRKTRIVTFTSPDSIEKMADFYKAALGKAGWKVPSSLLTSDGGMLAGEKDGKQVSIIFSRDQDTGATNAVVTIPNE